jgi:hypothetical protein
LSEDLQGPNECGYFGHFSETELTRPKKSATHFRLVCKYKKRRHVRVSPLLLSQAGAELLSVYLIKLLAEKTTV